MSELDAIFNAFARAFVGSIKDDKEVAFQEVLNRGTLDGSVDSLHEVDRYLTHVHKNREHLTPEQWHMTVLRAGAYLGEVIRHAAPTGEFEWIDYDEYVPKNPKLHEIIPERTVATCAFLVRRSGAMSMPLNKIARFVGEGPENSVHFFAVCDLKDWVKKST